VYEMPIEQGKIREFARATQSTSAAYDGPRAVAPPTFLTTSDWFWDPEGGAVPSQMDLDYSRVLHAREEFLYPSGPPTAGSVLTVERKLADCYERVGRQGGTLRFVVVDHVFRDAGTLVALQRSTTVETSQPPASSFATQPARAVVSAQIGTAMPARSFAPLTVTDFVRYAGASGAYHPLHYDNEFALEAGFPSLFSIGMLQAGLLATTLTDWLGPREIRRYAVRFCGLVWPGDALTCVAAITGTLPAVEGSCLSVEAECRNPAGGVVVSAQAEFCATRKGGAS
jgi:acyl dehydratase